MEGESSQDFKSRASAHIRHPGSLIQSSTGDDRTDRLQEASFGATAAGSSRSTNPPPPPGKIPTGVLSGVYS